jgi:L-rhamnose mutarotase
MKIFKSFLLILITAALFTGCIKQSETKDMTIKNETITKRVGGLIKVRPDYEERYIILHKHTFPGVLESIKRSNIRNYSIFLLDGILFSHYEYVGTNYDADMKAIGDETTKEWWKLTDQMQEPLPTRKEGEWWAGMELLISTDAKIKPYSEAKRIGNVAELNAGAEETVKDLFKKFDPALIELMKKSNLQNFTVYIKDGKIYMYSEYVGKNLEQDKKQLHETPEFVKFDSELSKSIKTTWKEMKEVFHTN